MEMGLILTFRAMRFVRLCVSRRSGFRLGHAARQSQSFFSAIIFAFSLCTFTFAAGPKWYFLAAGKRPRHELAKLTPDFDRKGWREVRFPHSFDRIQREDNVFGWYVCVLKVPKYLKGSGLVLDLGLIDDADVTYFNGSRVGAMGSFTNKYASAWSKDRRYRVPPALVRYGKANVIAVQVKDFGGIGGLIGQPYVGAILPQATSSRFLPGDGPAEHMAGLEFDDTKWTTLALPDLEWDKRQPKNPSFGWYRFKFDLPDGLSGKDLLVDLGVVYDVAACYLNGKLMGQIGSFPPKYFPQTAGRFRCTFPGEAVKPTGNLLALRVYNHCEFGGLVGIPSVAFADQSLLADQKSAAGALARLTKDPIDDAGANQLLRLCKYLVHSRKEADVAAACEAILKSAKAASDTARRARCLRVYALWLLGENEKAWQEGRATDFSRAVPYETAAAMASLRRVCSESLSGVLYMGRDTVTQGDWDFRYGVHEAVLCAMAAPFDVAHGIGPGLSFKLRTGSKDEVPRAWLGTRETTDRRALFLPMTKKRRYASWDDRGEIRPFDDKGPDLLLDISVPAGPHLLSFYLLDWDWHAGPHPRMQTILVLDDRMRLLTVVSTDKFGGGQYERFMVQGPREVRIRVSKHRSPCAVLSGLFLDKCLPLQGEPLVRQPLPKELQLLARRFSDLTKASGSNIIQMVQSNELASFEAGCLRLAKRKHAPGVLYWWLAECERIRADYVMSQKWWLKYLGAVRYSMPPAERGAALARIACQMDRLGYRPEAVLAAMRAAAREDTDDPGARMARMVKASRRAALGRVLDRWLADKPFSKGSPQAKP